LDRGRQSICQKKIAKTERRGKNGDTPKQALRGIGRVMTYPAVILAGGRSSRMGGRDKGLLPLGRSSILAEVIRRLSPQTGEMCINSNSDPGLFGETGLDVVSDFISGQLGPLAGILTAMRWARFRGASHVITVACDTPFLPRDLVARLSTASNDEIAVAAGSETLHPTVGLWPVRHAEKLEHDLIAGARSIRAWLASVPFNTAPFESDAIDPFLNINTPDDWERARAISDRLANSNDQT
jgi:molybdopterin-guanine dinucleotide biosynthesis protein A